MQGDTWSDARRGVLLEIKAEQREMLRVLNESSDWIKRHILGDYEVPRCIYCGDWTDDGLDEVPCFLAPNNEHVFGGEGAD